MKINSNNFTSQISKMNTPYRQEIQAQYQSLQNNSSSDEMSISKKGIAMNRMMGSRPSREDMQARKSTLDDTVKSLGIDKLDLNSMSEEEMREVMSSFQSSMSEYMSSDIKDSNDMSSSELKEMITNMQSMSQNISNDAGQYGPPAGMRPSGMKPAGMRPAGMKPANMDSDILAMLDSLTSNEADETDETNSSDLIDTLLEVLENEENKETDEVEVENKSENELILSLLDESSSDIGDSSEYNYDEI